MKPADAMRVVQPVLDRRGPQARPVPDNVVRIILLTRILTDAAKFIAHAWDCKATEPGGCSCGAAKILGRMKEAIR